MSKVIKMKMVRRVRKPKRKSWYEPKRRRPSKEELDAMTPEHRWKVFAKAWGLVP
jgi:hypothetical protein